MGNINPSQSTFVLEIIEALIVKESWVTRLEQPASTFFLRFEYLKSDLVNLDGLLITSTNNIKVRGLFLDELNQVSCIAEILLRLHIRDNIPTQGQDFLYPNLVQVSNGFSHLVLSQIDGWQVGNSRNRQVILDKVSQTNRRFR